jgi:hypothetical protein
MWDPRQPLSKVWLKRCNITVEQPRRQGFEALDDPVGKKLRGEIAIKANNRAEAKDEAAYNTFKKYIRGVRRDRGPPPEQTLKQVKKEPQEVDPAKEGKGDKHDVAQVNWRCGKMNEEGEANGQG